jgi:hypothetical protein
MKKILLLLICASPCYVAAVSIEADLSAFFPTESKIQKIYGNAWLDVGLTIDHIYPFHNFSIFGGVDYLYSNGESIGGKNHTKIEAVPITLGLKWIKSVHKNVEFYIGAAPKYYFMWIKNDSDLVPRKSHKSSCGGYATVGSFFYPVQGLMIDLFLSYSYVRFDAPKSSSSFKGVSTNLSGFNLGSGIGWKF